MNRQFGLGAADTTNGAGALAALALATLLPAMGTSIATIGLPAMASAFGATVAQIQWVVVGYLCAVTCLVVPAGRIGDARGRRRVLLAAIALFIAGSALAGAAHGLTWLVAARAVQGAGAAGMMALTLAFVVPGRGAGTAMGLLGTMSAAGTALGPALGGMLIAAGGWRGLFLINVPVGLLAFWLAWHTLPEPGIKAAIPAARAWASGATLPRLSMAFLVATVLMGTLVAGPFYLSAGLLLDPAAAGFVMAAGPLVAALCGVPAGRAVDRLGAAGMTRAGLALLGGGCLGMAFLPAALGVPAYLAALVTITAGYALFQAANNTAAMADAGPEQRGAMSGLLNLARNLGLLAGAASMGAVFALPGDAVSGLHLTFALASTLVIVALLLSLRQLRKTR